jgi:ribosomal protein S12 methylthiotransferase accessory factor
MELKVTLEQGKKVSTRVGEHVITTDQPSKYGGDDSAPAPYDLFLASIATCAGFYVRSYCDTKGIDPTGIDLTLSLTTDAKTKRVTGFVTTINIPASIPADVHAALRRAAAQCAVKKTIMGQPEFIVETVVRDA